MFTLSVCVCVAVSNRRDVCVGGSGVCSSSKRKAAVEPIPCSLPKMLGLYWVKEPQPLATPSPSAIGRKRPPPPPSSLACRQCSMCMRRREREGERGSSQCNGIEESKEEEEESEWELLDLPVVCWSWVYCRATLHWHRPESRPICTTILISSTRSHSSDTTSKAIQGPSSPGFLHHQGKRRRYNLGTNCSFSQFPLHLLPSSPKPPPFLSCSSLCPCPRRLL